MTMTKHLCVQFNKNCAVCPLKTSFITRFCVHHFECKIKREVKRKIHDYRKDIRMANELINKLAFLSNNGEIKDYNNYELIDNLSNEQKEYALKVLI